MFLTASKHLFSLRKVAINVNRHTVIMCSRVPQGLPELFWILAIPYTESVQQRLLWQKNHHPIPFCPRVVRKMGNISLPYN